MKTILSGGMQMEIPACACTCGCYASKCQSSMAYMEVCANGCGDGAGDRIKQN